MKAVNIKSQIIILCGDSRFRTLLKAIQKDDKLIALRLRQCRFLHQRKNLNLKYLDEVLQARSHRGGEKEWSRGFPEDVRKYSKMESAIVDNCLEGKI